VSAPFFGASRPYRTGDVGFLDSKDRLIIQGRLDTMVNVGGRNVLPEAVERKVRDFPGVVDVAIVGLPDPDGITRVRLCFLAVVGTETDDEALSQLCIEHLERPEHPVSIHLVTKIPRTQSGKIDLSACRIHNADTSRF
jgi:acyl-CoA synthetase (AMP-forming)/AMP-acid ligase II